MKTITILFYKKGLFGTRKEWQPAYRVTWAQYEEMAANRPGEGETWKAVFHTLHRVGE